MDFYLHDEGYRKQVDSMIKGANYRNVSDSIGKSVAKALYGQELVGSVTRLESYAECAYKHFLSYGLKLYKRALHEINVMDVGTMYHSVLQGFFEEIKENNYNWKDVDEELRDRIIEKNVVNVCKEYEEKGLFSSATNAYVANMVSRVSKKVADILVEHIGRGKFEPTYYELSFGIGKKLTDIRYMLDEDTCLRLGGIIDRVDICNHNGREYVKIIDYKKKDEIFKLPDVYEGLQLQMVVYLDEFIKRERAKGKEVVPAAALYFHITDPIIELSNSEEYNEDKCREKVVDSFAMKGIVNGDEGILELFEEKNEGKMKTLDIKETKGNMASNSKSCVTGTENIELLMKYVEKKIVSMGKEIMTGECDISPAETSGRNACSRCDYSDVCRFDSGFGNIEKTVKKMTEDEVWYKIREEMEIEAEGGKQSGLDG